MLNIYLLKVKVYDQLFHQKLFTTKSTQIPLSKIVLSQVYICLSVFHILNYINVIFLFTFNITFSLYNFFCRALLFSFQSYLTSLITKASVKILPLSFFNKLSYLLGVTFWKIVFTSYLELIVVLFNVSFF